MRRVVASGRETQARAISAQRHSDCTWPRVVISTGNPKLEHLDPFREEASG